MRRALHIDISTSTADILEDVFTKRKIEEKGKDADSLGRKDGVDIEVCSVTIQN